MKKFIKKYIGKFVFKLLKVALLNSSKKSLFQLFEHLKTNHQNYIYEIYRAKYNIDGNFKLNGQGIKFYGEGDITGGDHSYIGDFSTIQSAGGCKVTIGKNCAISHNVRIYTLSYVADQEFNSESKKEYKADVEIQDNVWIGANVFINPGIVIGKNSVIGANSVVTKDIPPDAVYGGVPAKLIRYKTKNVS